jgi:hypothetical protein
VTRAQINVDPHTARLIVSSDLPTLYKGVPLRLRTLKVEVNRPNFLFNPTNCAALSTDTSLTSTMGATDSLSSPFAVSGCSSLPFKPKLTVSTSPRTSRLNGSSLTVKLTQGSGQANIREVHTELPKLLPARLSTLQKACRDEVFEANPATCPAASKVGTATASTPVLPDKLSGPAYLVSHGGAAFPDLEIVLSGDGVSVILDGKTNIKNGITSSTFTTIPDVPVNSFELKLPAGRDSAITAIGETCAKRLIMPTAIVSQGSQTIKQNIKIAVKGCPPRILSKKIRGRTVTLVLAVAGAGTITAGGGQLTRVSRRLAKATHVTLKLGLSGHGRTALSRAGKLKTRLLIGFTEKGGAHSKTQTSVRFR